MRCYAILNSNLHTGGTAAWSWAQDKDIQRQVHLNRCVYWLAIGSQLEFQFVLRYSAITHRVPQEDYA